MGIGESAHICPECGYDLRGQTVERCPECGFRYDPASLEYFQARRVADALSPALDAVTVLVLALVLVVFPRPAVGVGIWLNWCGGVLAFVVLCTALRSWVLGEERVVREAFRYFFGQILGREPGVLTIVVFAGVWCLPAVLFLDAVRLVLSGAALVMGWSWTVLSEVRRRGPALERTEALPFIHQVQFRRARIATWTLCVLDLFLWAQFIARLA